MSPNKDAAVRVHVDPVKYLNTVNAAALFAAELGRLPKAVHAWVLAAIGDLAPLSFWSVPASMSGKYHPRACRRLGGLVVHTRYAIRWFDRLTERGDLKVDDTVRGAGIAALLLHDMHKYGCPGDLRNRAGYRLADATPTAVHGHWTADLLEGFAADYYRRQPGLEFELAPVLRLAIPAVRYHMGEWGLGWSDVLDDRFDRLTVRLVWTVHMADYCAAMAADDALADVADLKGGRP